MSTESEQSLSDAINALARALPALVADVGALATIKTRLEYLIEEVREEREVARLFRKDVREATTAMAEANRILDSKVQVMEPLVFDYREQRAQGRGYRQALNLIWGLAVALASAVGALIGKKWG